MTGAVSQGRRRPTYDRAKVQPIVIGRLRSGETLQDICSDMRIGRETFWRWTQADRVFGADFRDAQVIGAAVQAAPLTDIQRDERAYVAGFFDGEGCIRLQRGAVQKSGMRYYFPVVLVSGTDEDSIKFLHDRWPGVFQFKNRNGYNPNARPIWTWQRSGVSAEVFLRDIRPYLRLKKPQADLVTEYLAFVGDRRRTHDRAPEDDAYMIDFYVRMALLNHRGLAPPKIRTD